MSAGRARLACPQAFTRLATKRCTTRLTYSKTCAGTKRRVAKALRHGGIGSSMFRFIHPQDAHRLAELDVIASMQPIHATSDMVAADRYWGARTAYAYNPRLQLDHGARVAFGSDAPVEPLNPLLGIHAAVTRERDGAPVGGWRPEAKLNVHEALLGFTQGAAYAAGMEDRLGKLAEGYLADLVVLDRNIFEIAPEEIPELNVLGTMVDGAWRYREFD